jgi:hypothetical protein
MFFPEIMYKKKREIEAQNIWRGPCAHLQKRLIVAAVHMVFRRRRIKGRLKEQKYI